MRRWKIGLVGAGWWSDKHLQAWKRIPNAELAAICDLDPAKARAKGEAYAVPADRLYTAFDRMLAEADIDVVDIVTGPDTHLELVTKAAFAGKHVLCQKPFALSLEDAEMMVRAAQSAGVRLMVTENWRWLQPFRTIKKLLEDGAIGEPRVARYVHTDYYTPRMTPDAELPQPFFRTMPNLLFYEMGVHWFDTWRYLFGTPGRLYAETLRISPHVQGEDSGIVVLARDGFYGFLDASWATRQQLDRPLGDRVGPVHLERLAIDGERGTIKLHASGRITLVGETGSEERTVRETSELDHEESHYRLQSHFIACLDSGEPFQTSGEDNLVTLRMVFGVYESARLHMPVTLEGARRDDH